MLVENIFGYAVWVEYFPSGSNHGHVMLISTPDESIAMSTLLVDIEEYAAEFAGMFDRCDGERHKGKAHRHSNEEIQEAYRQAVGQLLTKDFAQEWADIKAKERAWKRWGGPVPKFTMHPTIEDPSKWEVIVTDKEGTPTLYDIPKGVIDDVVPDPREKTTIMDKDGTPIVYRGQPNEEGIGWTLKEDKDAS